VDEVPIDKVGERPTMAHDKSWPKTDKVKQAKVELADRERMTARALSRIRQSGTAAALDKCNGLADQINAKLLKLECKDFAQASEVQELRAFLERAAAVLKKL
jgi:hypothetical protein